MFLARYDLFLLYETDVMHSRSSTSSLLNIRPSRCVTLGDRSVATAGPRLWNSLYLLTSGLPRHSQHFVKSWKFTYFGNLTQTSFY